MKIGLIAGQGKLPHYVLSGAQSVGHETLVIGFKGITKVDAFSVDVKEFGLAEFGGIVKYLKREKCTHVCMAGVIERPDFSDLKPDMKGLKYFPGALSASKRGDDALLTYIVSIFEKEGFEIVSPQSLCAELLIGDGHLGAVKLTSSHRDDALKACEIARYIGAKDIGQGAIVCGGLVLAVEAQDGTDAMLTRITDLPVEMRGRANERRGVLAKLLKPAQEDRVDMPTIGPETIRLAEAAGLAGIVVESGRAFCIDKAETIDAANAAGIFIVGLPVTEDA